THRHISVQLSVLPLEWKKTKVNVIDTPGYSDFYGEVLEALRVVDGIVILLEAVSGVEVGAERVWDYATTHALPRMVVISKMDRENADFNRSVDQLRERFGKQVVPVHLPIGSQESFDGIVDLIAMKAYRGSSGDPVDIPADLRDAAESAREQVV